MNAEKDTDNLKSWDRVYRSYKHFSQCDQGAIGEGYSDAIAELLANQWGQFDRFVTLAGRDAAFQQFVLRHIDETVPAETLLKISENARSDCMLGAQHLCELVVNAATEKQTTGRKP